VICFLQLAAHATPESDLPARVKDFFRRQIAWFEHVLSDLERIEQDLHGAAPEELAAQTARHAQGMARFEQEFQHLTREWRSASDVAASDRAEIRALARRVEALIGDLGKARDRATELIGQQAGAIERALNETRKGQTMLRRYYAGDRAYPGFIDKRA